MQLMFRANVKLLESWSSSLYSVLLIEEILMTELRVTVFHNSSLSCFLTFICLTHRYNERVVYSLYLFS